MRMGVPESHGVLLRKFPAVIARERSDRSNLAGKVRWDCHPFAEFILSEAEGLRASAYLVARNDKGEASSAFVSKGLFV